MIWYSIAKISIRQMLLKIIVGVRSLGFKKKLIWKRENNMIDLDVNCNIFRKDFQLRVKQIMY